MTAESKRVRDLIAEALLALLEKKPFPEITVTDLVAKAQVARVSFYRNFNSTNDVLDYITDHLMLDFSSVARPALLANDERQLRDFLFGFIYKTYYDRMRLSKSDPANLSVIFSRLEARITSSENERMYGCIEDKYSLAAKTGIVMSVLRVWISTGAKEAPEQIVDLLTQTLLKT